MKSIHKIQLSLIREKTVEYSQTIRTGRDIAPIAREMIGNYLQENFLGFYLSTRNKIIGVKNISQGTVDYCPVHPRDVFIPALLTNSTNIIVCHNHPSGDPTISKDDILLTERLKQAGDLLGISLLDHVIIGSERYYSVAEQFYYEF